MRLSILTTLIVTTLISCSKDDAPITNQVEQTNLKNFIYKTYDIETNDIINETTYTIEDWKITEYSGTNTTTNETSSGTFHYTNNKISEVFRYRDEIVVSKRNYTYNSEGELSNYIVESLNTTNPIKFRKITFNHTSDTIYAETGVSEDGVIYNSISTHKIILDENNNRTHYETYNILNDEFKVVKMEYDANNNAIKEEFYSNFNDELLSTLENTIEFDNTTNTLYKVYEETYGRKNLMLLYHTFSSAINNFNVKNISKNNIVNFNTTFGGDLFSFEFDKTVNEDNFSNYNEYKTFDTSSLFNFFSYNFLFE